MNKLTRNDIKQALWHENFRNLFPELKKEIDAFLQKPGCSCNNAGIMKFFQYPDRLHQYFPTKEISTPASNEPPECKWIVINCHMDELEVKLKELGDSAKQVVISRFEDQITAVINIIG
jgi:hypothetical protein